MSGRWISDNALDALDAVLDLTVDVLDGTTPATPDERRDLAAELCKARGMVLEARDHRATSSLPEQTP